VALAGVIALVVSLVILRRYGPARSNQPGFRNDSQRPHELAPAQTWAKFLKETYRGQKNSGATVKLGSGFELGIVGESFHLPELQWVRTQHSGAGPVGYRTRFNAYLIAEPENPHSPTGTAVRVESPRGGTIGHLSGEQAESYAPVFKALHAAQRVGMCRAVALGGTEGKPNIGVWINIGHSAWLAELINEAQQPLPARQKRGAPKQEPIDQPF
jgi:hypothetical protein